MVKSVDTRDLKSLDASRAGSSPARGTIQKDIMLDRIKRLFGRKAGVDETYRILTQSPFEKVYEDFITLPVDLKNMEMRSSTDLFFHEHGWTRKEFLNRLDGLWETRRAMHGWNNHDQT